METKIMKKLIVGLSIAVILAVPVLVSAADCVVPQIGGTVELPAPCPYRTLPAGPMTIIDGLPAGSTIEIDATLDDFTCQHTGGLCSLPLTPGVCEIAGGTLGGNGHCFEANLTMEMTGTGALTGFNRTLVVPVEVEIHTAPRIPGDPIQEFSARIYRISGTLFGDPDFCVFYFSGGNDYGLPSPGEFALIEQPSGDFAVESFFDITYQIEFEGCPGSVLDGLSGITTGVTRWQQGDNSVWNPGDPYKMHFPQLPDEEGWDVNATFPLIIGDDWTCSETGWIKDLHFWGSWLGGVEGTISSFTVTIREDVPAGVDEDYSHPGNLLWEKEVTSFTAIPVTAATLESWYDPSLDFEIPGDHSEYFQYNILLDPDDWFWQVEGTIYWLCISANVTGISGEMWGWKTSLDHWVDYGAWNAREGMCTAPDNGTGTVDLPADCPYQTAENAPMVIVDGLPPGTTIECDATLNNFTCTHVGGLCSLPLASGVCEGVGGTLGGRGHCFEAYLNLVMTGTGDLVGFSRNITVPVELEVHTAPRNPGDPVQTFTIDMYRLQGQLFGDPDFCTFQITAGTDYGLPSPGSMTLTELPNGDFAVESFFDVTYQIQFEGCPGSVLEGFVGITTDTKRWYQGLLLTDNWDDLGIAAATCTAPDNGSGTPTLPADCPYTNAADDPMYIIDGLPPSTTIEMAAVLDNYTCDHSGASCSLALAPGVCEGAGGSLGGDGHCFEAYLNLTMTGTGALNGFFRQLTVPVDLEIHTASRNPGDPLQTFSADLYRLQGELFGDPDFCLFRIAGGTDYGLPSPGSMTLTKLPDGDFAVESFFDITYQIEFQGCPGSVLDGMAGITTATVRWSQGEPVEMQMVDLAFVVTGDAEDPACDCGLWGDVTGDGAINPVDVVYMVNFVYKNINALVQPPNCPESAGDVNCDSQVNPVDVVFYVNFVYKNINNFCADPCGP